MAGVYWNPDLYWLASALGRLDISKFTDICHHACRLRGNRGQCQWMPRPGICKCILQSSHDYRPLETVQQQFPDHRVPKPPLPVEVLLHVVVAVEAGTLSACIGHEHRCIAIVCISTSRFAWHFLCLADMCCQSLKHWL